MKQENVIQLKNKFPELLEKISDIQCSDGWYGLINSLFCAIETHRVYNMPEELQNEYHAIQIKEKFGQLRVYFNHTTPFINGAIAVAEFMSTSTCEECSLPGQLRGKTWMQCLCDSCYDKENKHRSKLAK